MGDSYKQSLRVLYLHKNSPRSSVYSITATVVEKASDWKIHESCDARGS